MGDDRTGGPLLFEPIAIRSVTARNRVVVSPMCQYSAPEAVPHEWHYLHLATRAVGGAGIVFTEATAVEPRGRISPWDVGLWNDEQERAFARIAERVAEHGAVPAMQLAHAGRKASHLRPWEDRRPIPPEAGGWEVVGPSAVPWEAGDLVPRELTGEEIAAVVERWREAAERTLRAGFRMLEIHAAHGYLLHSFLSPISNRRRDAYGGSLENRMRLLMETVEAVRDAWPSELPLSVRLSATDWLDGGWTVEDTVVLADRLKGLEVDVVVCSSGGTSPDQHIESFPGYQVRFAERVRREVGILTGAVGLLYEPRQVEQVLAEGRADLAVLARMLLWDPYWPHHAAAALGAGPTLPVQYERSAIHARNTSFLPPA